MVLTTMIILLSVLKNEFIENIEIKDGLQNYVAGILKDDFVYPLLNGSTDMIDTELNLRESLIAPISKGDVLGSLVYYLDGKAIGNVEIISTMDVELIL